MTAPERPRRRRAPADRPQEILAAALGEFADKGFAATRLDDVARRAGCSKAAIYLYYADKNALFEAVIRSALLPDLEAVRAMILGAPGSASDILRLLAQRAIRRMLDGTTPDLIKIVIGESRVFPELARFWHEEVIARMLPVLTHLVERGMASGEFRKVDAGFTARSLVAPLIFSAIWQSVFERVGAGPLDAGAFIDHHLDIMLAGLKPQPAGPQEPRP
jgi:AcrR family transcriptional regulator